MFNFLKMKFKPSKIYLVHMPQWNISQPPMGIAYIGSYLRSKGKKVILSDFSIELYDQLPPNQKHIMDNGAFHVNWIHEETYRTNVFPLIDTFITECSEKIINSKAKIIGFSVLSTNLHPTLDIIKIIKKKKPELQIIIGGPYVTRYEGAPFVIEQEGVDFVLPDEGEETAEELTTFIQKGITDFEKVKGVIFKKDGQVIDTGKRDLITDINQLPYPIYESFPLEKYHQGAIPLLGSRGCIFKCAFCSETILWRRYRYRTGRNIVDEMKHHLRSFNTNYFYIVDSLINGNMNELIQMCEYIIKEDLKVIWGGKVSIRTQMTKEVLELMAKAGCHNLQYGIESGSPKVIRDMRKGFTIPIARRVLKDTYDVGIKTGCFFLVGFPTETEENYQETKDFLTEIQNYIHEVTPGYGMGLQPGSEVHDNPTKFGIKFDEHGNWYSDIVTGEVIKNRVEDFRIFCNQLDVTLG